MSGQRPADAIAQIIQDTFDRVSTPQIAPGRVPGGRERAAAEAILASVIFRDPAESKLRPPVVDREALARLIRFELTKDKSGFGSCDLGADTADAILASGILRDPADVWDQAMATARTAINRRTSIYEADIDLLAEPNPYRTEGSTK